MDTVSLQIISAKTTNMVPTAFAVVKKRPGRDFEAVFFKDMTFSTVVVSEKGLSFDECTRSSEPWMVCPAPRCEANFRIDAITQHLNAYLVFSGQFLYLINKDMKTVIDMIEIQSALNPLSGPANATYVQNNRLHVISGDELFVF